MKFVANRFSKYRINKGFIRPKQFGFRNQEEYIYGFTLYYELYVRDVNLQIKISYLGFFDFKKKRSTQFLIYNVLMNVHHLGIRGKFQ